MHPEINNAVGPQVRGQSVEKNKLVPFMVIFSFILGLQAATQFFAYKFYYQSVLGSNISGFYPFWSILNWYSKWHEQYASMFFSAGNIGTLATAIGLIFCFMIKMTLANSSKANPYLHGSARWANKKDIENAGLFGEEGVYVGAWQEKNGNIQYLRHNGPEHILTYAPTRSGKGVGLVVPTLLSWPHSAVITDLKGELWAMTAGWRQQHAKNKVLRFEPATDYGSICWNPLDEIRLGTQYEVGDVQNIATLIVDPDGKGLESHWQKTSQALLVGVILHVLYRGKEEGTPANLPAVDAILADRNKDITKLWVEMTEYLHTGSENHPAVAAAARDMMDRAEEEAGSVLSTAKSYLSLYRDPIVAKNVSKSEFFIKDLMNHENPISLYIITQPNDKSRLRPLVRIMMNMIVRLLADKMEFERVNDEVKFSWVSYLLDIVGIKQESSTTSYIRSKKNYKHRLLGMIDEFPSLGKLEILQESLAFVAGYGIKFYLICQDLNQLKSRETGYGPDETITSNCHIQNAYPPNRVETAEHLSKLTGQTNITKEQITTSGRRTSVFLGQVSRTYHEVQRPLLTVDECLRMPAPQKSTDGQIEEAGDMVIYVAGYPAIYGKQPLYFKDPIFMARAAVPEPQNTDKIRLNFKKNEVIKI
jgi:type IV secretion system protein VirD4